MMNVKKVDRKFSDAKYLARENREMRELLFETEIIRVYREGSI